MNNTNAQIQIQNFLPHRKPMLMVDIILDLSKEDVKTTFKITEDNVFVENGYFIEAGLIENAAQTCSSIVGHTFFLDDSGNIKEDVKLVGFISGIKKVAIKALPKVGATITTTANLLSKFDSENYSICNMSCITSYEGNEIVEAEINLMIQQV